LTANGVKFTPENVIATGQTPDGQVVFLETGNSSAGLQHIVEAHGDDFANIGVTEDQIPSLVMQAVTEGNVVGYQGAGVGRPIYSVTINGQAQGIAVTTGSNGFIVGANPTGAIK
jgi:filamentous hemagglutinin